MHVAEGWKSAMVATEVGAFDQSEKLGDYQISVELRDAGGQVAGRFQRAAAPTGEATLSLKVPIAAAHRFDVSQEE